MHFLRFGEGFVTSAHRDMRDVNVKCQWTHRNSRNNPYPELRHCHAELQPHNCLPRSTARLYNHGVRGVADLNLSHCVYTAPS
ncbi:hypothetical protein BD410DRAFT_789855 [Rickenella mellea]|uniref:Uncharacterized protein n=1 Tax=Rickenella mellea TaxID=50990 RepID=A0A4Y7Q2H3_9AGAM|nr:hypothetical protein BD410DRAFT_789855 [Rickenella mellea]